MKRINILYRAQTYRLGFSKAKDKNDHLQVQIGENQTLIFGNTNYFRYLCIVIIMLTKNIMRIRLFFIILSLFLCFTSLATADDRQLEGFSYGAALSPTGNEWESPELLGYNKLQPRAWYVSFSNEEDARHLLPEHSTRRLDLNGVWKFHFAKSPDKRPSDFYQPAYDVSNWDDIEVPSSWNIVGIQKDGTQKYGTPIYVNQPVIFWHQVKKDDWRGGVMREPPHNWTTYEYRNEVGSYRRTFTLPSTWKNDEIFIEFDGVDSFFYLWINGQYVGFSKNSRDAARFDITRFVRPGENTVSVEVYRNSDGSFLEAQDMFRLPGIYRSVSVYSTPKVHIADLRAIPRLSEQAAGGNAAKNRKDYTLDITAEIENLSQKRIKNYTIEYSLYENRLYQDEGSIKIYNPQPVSPAITINKRLSATQQYQFVAKNIKEWTAEEPNVYILVAALKNNKGKTVEAISTQIGFRTVEIKNVAAEDDEFGLAGRYFLINGKPVKLKGVNRHETNPARGHAITHKQMEEEVMMMKRANINHVRTSHYSNDPYFYYLCNKYGIYLEGEANVESHEYYYGEASLSHPQEWKAAHVARMMEQAHARINDPCIVIWSLGNEAGPGDNFKASYQALKAFDTSRPVQYERNNDIVDMGSNQYPSIAWVRDAVKGKMKIKYPFHISEYAHSMGNAVGNLIDYWDAIESTNYFCGGAIWDWIDQSMYNYTSDGKRYLAYGGDFGDFPNDKEFVMNGILFGDMEPKPQYAEVKKVYQYVGIKWADREKSLVSIFNKNYYSDDLSGYDFHFLLTANGEVIEKGNLNVGSIAPRSQKIISIPALQGMAFDPQKDYYLTIQLRQHEDVPWAKAGYVQAEEQLEVSMLSRRIPLNTTGHITVEPKANNHYQTLTGENFKVQFDLLHGFINSLEYDGQTIFTEGNGPKIDAFRACVNNDNWAMRSWYENGLNRLEHKTLSYILLKNRPNGSVVYSFNIESKAPDHEFKFLTNLVYTVYPDGSIEIQSSITSNKPSLVLPRLGFAMQAVTGLDKFSYYGRGPVDNYPDRKTGQKIGWYQSTVEREFINFPKPQDMANHQDSRMCALTNNAGKGFYVVAEDKMSVSALPWSAQEMDIAKHPHELPPSSGNWLHIDLAITGLGGNSCGQGGPLEKDRVKASAHDFAFMIRPVRDDVSASSAQGFEKLEGAAPLTIVRNADGLVTISSKKKDAVIFYKTVTKQGTSKVRQYTEPINMRNGGTVIAYEEKEPYITNQQYFERIESIPLQVVFASSVESGEGNAEYLVDGNPNTYWHTMWSVTVANYPHWVDFDCGSVKTLKGFKYLPRQDSRNGNIRQYSIQVSDDGNKWSQPVCEGEFANDQKEKRVLFEKPVSARFVRFNALSSQDGQDFATGAEFSILEK